MSSFPHENSGTPPQVQFSGYRDHKLQTDREKDRQTSSFYFVLWTLKNIFGCITLHDIVLVVIKVLYFVINHFTLFINKKK